MCTCTRTYSQNVVVSCSQGLSQEHHSGSAVDGEPALLVSIHDAVRQSSVGTFVWVKGRHSEHGVSFPPPLPLWDSNPVDLLQEHRLVVVLVQDPDHHPGGTVSRTLTTVRYQNLENRAKEPARSMTTWVQPSVLFVSTSFLYILNHCRFRRAIPAMIPAMIPAR